VESLSIVFIESCLPEPGFLELLFCSTTAGAVGGAFGNPADVINVRMQNDGQLAPELRRHYKHAFDGLIRIAKEEGVKSLARGIGPNMGRAVLMTASQLTSYDVFKELLITKAHMRSEGVLTHFSSSLLAVSAKMQGIRLLES
jgi:solute carrier family 25 (mitochondrial dicarboxylate transporter), member 10